MAQSLKELSFADLYAMSEFTENTLKALRQKHLSQAGGSTGESSEYTVPAIAQYSAFSSKLTAEMVSRIVHCERAG